MFFIKEFKDSYPCKKKHEMMKRTKTRKLISIVLCCVLVLASFINFSTNEVWAETGVKISDLVVGTALEGETVEFPNNKTVTMQVNIGGDTAYIGRSITIDIPQGLRLVSGTGIASVEDYTYTKNELTPTQKLVWADNPTWVSDGNITKDDFSLAQKSGSLTYYINDGVSDGTVILELQAEASIYDYSGNQILNDIEVTATGNSGGAISTDTKKVGVKLNGVKQNPSATLLAPETSFTDINQSIKLSLSEAFSYENYNNIYGDSFNLTYPEGAVISNPPNGYTLGKEIDNGDNTCTVKFTRQSGKKYVYTSSKEFLYFNVFYPNEKFSTGDIAEIKVSEFTYNTMSLKNDGSLYYTPHILLGSVSDTTEIVDEAAWNPTYFNNIWKNQETYNTTTNYPTLAKTEMNHNGYRSKTPVRYSFAAGSEIQSSIDNVSSVDIALPGKDDLSQIHIEFDDGTSTTWNVGEGTMPGSFVYNKYGKITAWSYNAPGSEKGVPIKNITGAYIQFSKSDYTSGGGICTVKGRPKSETTTDEYSEHTFASWQYNEAESKWVKIESTVTNGFRWQEPTKFNLVERASNRDEYIYGDTVNKSYTLAGFSVANNTGSNYNATVKVEYDFDTDNDSVKSFYFPYSIKSFAEEGANTVESIKWKYENDDTVYTWRKESGEPYPFEATRYNGGIMNSKEGKSFENFEAVISQWSEVVGNIGVSITGSPKTADVRTAHSKHILKISAIAGEEENNRILCTKEAGFKLVDIKSTKIAIRASTFTINAGGTGKFEVVVFNENGYYLPEITFAIAFPPDLMPTGSMATVKGVFSPNGKNDDSDGTARLKKTRTLTDTECTNLNLPSGSTIWFYDLEDQKKVVTNTTGAYQTILNVSVPVKASPFANTRTYQYRDMFFVGSNKTYVNDKGDTVGIDVGYINNIAFYDKGYLNNENTINDKIGIGNRFVSTNNGSYIKINKDPAWIVEEAICNDNDGEYKTYINGNNNTIVGFEKNQTGKIKLTVSNTVADNDISVYDGYVFLPIPKAGNRVSSSGMRSQSEFDFMLTGEAKITEGSENVNTSDIRYLMATDEVTSTNANTLFENGSKDFNVNATMIAVKLNKLQSSKNIEITVPIKAPNLISNNIKYNTFQARSVYPFQGTSYGTYNSGLKSGWLKTSYMNQEWNVDFEVNGGIAVDSQKVENKEKAKYKTTTRAGYTFDGWCTDEELTKYYDFDSPVTNNITLYAKWTEKTPVLIKYEADNGGNVSLARESVKPATGTVKGSKATADAGYKFVGWYDKNHELVSKEENFIPAKIEGLNVSATYTARFEAINADYKIEYYQQDINDETKYNKVDVDTYIGSELTNSNVLVTEKKYTGFTFQKTTFEKNGMEASETVLPVAGDGSLVIKLYYSRNSCQVTFKNAQKGGILKTISDELLNIDTYKQEKKAGQKASNEVKTANNDGYVLASWSYKMDIDGELRTGTVNNYTDLTILGDTEFTPMFVKSPYIIIKSLENGYVSANEKGNTDIPDVGTDVTAKREWSANDSIDKDIAVAFKAKEHYKIKSITLNMPQSDYNKENIEIPLTDRTDIDAIAEGMVDSGGSASLNLAKDMKSGSIVVKNMIDNCVFTVEYEPINFEVSFDTNGGSENPANQTIQEGSNATKPVTPIKDGYTFVGWQYKDGSSYKDFDFGTPITSDLKLTAKLIEKSINILYLSDDTKMGTVNSSKESLKIWTGVAEGVTAKANKGYHFVNWTKNGIEVSTNEIFVPAKVLNKNIEATYVANFAVNSYHLNIIYEYEDGTEASKPVNKILDYGSTYSFTSPKIEGYTASQSSVTGSIPDSDVTVKVVYKKMKNLKYVVEHYQQTVDNGGKYELKESEEFTGSFNDEVNANAKTYVGFTENTIIKDRIATGNVKADESLVLKLYYDRNKNNVFYEYYGVVPEEAPKAPHSKENVIYGERVDVQEAPSLEGYIFSGWSTEDATVGEGIFEMPDENVTLKGKWTPKDYSVKYNLAGGKIGDDKIIPDKTNVTYYQQGLLTSEKPIKKGYTFMGWAKDRITVLPETKYQELVEDDSIESITLTAIWIKNPVEEGNNFDEKKGGTVNNITSNNVKHATETGDEDNMAKAMLMAVMVAIAVGAIIRPRDVKKK